MPSIPKILFFISVAFAPTNGKPSTDSNTPTNKPCINSLIFLKGAIAKSIIWSLISPTFVVILSVISFIFSGIVTITKSFTFVKIPTTSSLMPVNHSVTLSLISCTFVGIVITKKSFTFVNIPFTSSTIPVNHSVILSLINCTFSGIVITKKSLIFVNKSETLSLIPVNQSVTIVLISSYLVGIVTTKKSLIFLNSSPIPSLIFVNHVVTVVLISSYLAGIVSVKNVFTLSNKSPIPSLIDVNHSPNVVLISSIFSGNVTVKKFTTESFNSLAFSGIVIEKKSIIDCTPAFSFSQPPTKNSAITLPYFFNTAARPNKPAIRPPLISKSLNPLNAVLAFSFPFSKKPPTRPGPSGPVSKSSPPPA